MKGGSSMNFATQVRIWRKEADLTTTEAAAKIGVAQPSWQEWENVKFTGQRERNTCLKIAQALDKPESVVLAAAGYDTVKPDADLAQQFAIMEESIPASMRPKFRRVAIHTLSSLASEMATA